MRRDDSQLATRLPAGAHTLTLNATSTSGETSTMTTRVVVPRRARRGSRDRPRGQGAGAEQVFVCSPGPQDKPDDVAAGGGPPNGCTVEVQFGLVDAVGCLHPITTPSQWPKAETRS